MPPRHVVELALDLVRMPALARASVAPPIPGNVIDLMRLAAASPKACEEAASVTGESAEVLIEAARFYLQQLLFRPEADCYRILGIHPDTPRATAREHMRWLLEWVHPDRNSGLEAVYAERVLKAWREFSAPRDAEADVALLRAAPRGPNGASASLRLPWIAFPIKRSRGFFRRAQRTALWAIPSGLLVFFLALCLAAYYFGPEHLAAMVLRPPAGE